MRRHRPPSRAGVGPSAGGCATGAGVDLAGRTASGSLSSPARSPDWDGPHGGPSRGDLTWLSSPSPPWRRRSTATSRRRSPASQRSSTRPGPPARGWSCCPRRRSAATSPTCRSATSVEPPPALDAGRPRAAPPRRARRRRPRRHGRVLRAADDGRYNAAACVAQGEVLAVHRKVHQPLGEGSSYAAGCGARGVRHAGRPDRHADLLRQGLPRGGADARARRRRDRRLHVGVAGRAAPARAATIEDDRWTHRFDLFDHGPRAGQPAGVGGVQPDRHVRLAALLGHAKVVGPGGDVLAITGDRTGAGDRHASTSTPSWPPTAPACACLRDRRPDAYRLAPWIEGRAPAMAGGGD